MVDKVRMPDAELFQSLNSHYAMGKSILPVKYS
jgi:hypothetical protein